MSQIINITAGPATIHHTICQGDDLVISRTIKKDGVAEDISGDTFTMVIKNPKGGVLHTLTVGSGITLTPVGIYTYALTDTQTAALLTGCELPFALRRTKADGLKKTLEMGWIMVIKDVTA